MERETPCANQMLYLDFFTGSEKSRQILVSNVTLPALLHMSVYKTKRKRKTFIQKSNTQLKIQKKYTVNIYKKK